MFLQTLVALAALALAVPYHPHNPKALKLHGAKGMVTVTYFTVPFNAEHLTALKPGFDWHLGYATLETQVELICGEQKVAPAKYKLNVRRGADKDAWTAVLVPADLARAEGAVQRARRQGDDAVKEAQGKLDVLKASLQEKGIANETVLALTSFEAKADEHLTLVGIHHGYDAVARFSEEPAGGMHCSLRFSFGDLHRDLDLREVFDAPAKK